MKTKNGKPYKYVHGIPVECGEMRYNAKLTEEKVREARARRAAGEQVKDIAKDMGVHRTVISRVLNGRMWTHVN